jgi:hypothetical protein
MPLMSGMLLKTGGDRPRAVWALANRNIGGSILRPYVYYKPVGGGWQLQYSGADIPAADSCAFTFGVRNPGDPEGTISVRVDYRINGALPNNINANTYVAAQSTDRGVNWSLIGLTTGTRRVEAEDSAANSTPDSSKYTSPDTFLMTSAICSPAPGVLATIARQRVGVVSAYSREWYEHDLGLALSTNGASFVYAGGGVPSDRFDTSHDPFGGAGATAFFATQLVALSVTNFAPRAIVAGRPGAAPLCLGAGYFQLASGIVAGGYSFASYGAELTSSSWTQPTLPIDVPQAAIWDGAQFALAGQNNSDTTQRVYGANDAVAWSGLTSPGAGAFVPAAAASGRGKWLFGGTMTKDSGSTWHSSSAGTLAAATWAGTRFYAVRSLTLASSQSGTSWTDESLTLPSSTSFYDIFS